MATLDTADLTAAARWLTTMATVVEEGAAMNRHDAAIRYRGALTLMGELTGLPEADLLAEVERLASDATPRTIAYVPTL